MSSPSPTFRALVTEHVGRLVRRHGLIGDWTNLKDLEFTISDETKTRKLILEFGETNWKQDKGARSQYPVCKGMSVGWNDVYEQHKAQIDTILNDFQCSSELAADVLMLTPIERLVEVVFPVRKDKEERKD
jgi:hypothetical protein